MNPRIQFRNYLPALYRAAEVNGVSFFSQFLNAFELLFEGMEAEIEGDPDPSTGMLTGGIPDVFSVAATPPAQFANRPAATADNPDPDFDFLTYLASWLGLSLRTDPVQKKGETDAAYFARRSALNREFFNTAITFYPQRGTLAALSAMLQAWLQDELLPVTPPLPIVTDLRPSNTDVNTVFQLGVQPGATLGFDTVLGEGPAYLFVVDLVLDPSETALRNPVNLDIVQKAARVLLDAEKPAHTDYQLRVRAQSMQLAAPGEVSINGGPAAQLGVTTLLWECPWVFDSD